MPASTVTVRAGRVERNYLVHRPQREQVVLAVRDVVEAVAGAEYFQMALLFYKIPRLLQRIGGVQVFGAVFEIARPVFQFVAGHFVPLSPIQANSGEMKGVANIADESLRKVLLSMA